MIDRELFELQRLVFQHKLLTRRNFAHVVRWPGALAITISALCSRIVYLAGAPPWARPLAAFLGGFAAMSWLAMRAWRRYVRRQWNSLEA